MKRGAEEGRLRTRLSAVRHVSAVGQRESESLQDAREGEKGRNKKGELSSDALPSLLSRRVRFVSRTVGLLFFSDAPSSGQTNKLN